MRPSENIDNVRLEAFVRNKSVIVTGGGGTIGAEICERVVTFGAGRLLVIENSEPALYAVTEALAAHATGPVIEGRIADIRDRERIRQLMSEFRPDIVFMPPPQARADHRTRLEEGVKTSISERWGRRRGVGPRRRAIGVTISTEGDRAGLDSGFDQRFAEMYARRSVTSGISAGSRWDA